MNIASGARYIRLSMWLNAISIRIRNLKISFGHILIRIKLAFRTYHRMEISHCIIQHGLIHFVKKELIKGRENDTIHKTERNMFKIHIKKVKLMSFNKSSKSRNDVNGK